jgi:hypothetical protein
MLKIERWGRVQGHKVVLLAEGRAG